MSRLRQMASLGSYFFSGNVTVADGTVGNAVQAATASSIVRPASRTTTAGLQATDTLTMGNLLDARGASAPQCGARSWMGVYNCYLDPVSARQLFSDPDFKQLFQGATSSNPVFRQGMVSDFLGLRFITTTEAYVQNHPSIENLFVRRADCLRPGCVD